MGEKYHHAMIVLPDLVSGLSVVIGRSLGLPSHGPLKAFWATHRDRQLAAQDAARASVTPGALSELQTAIQPTHRALPAELAARLSCLSEDLAASERRSQSVSLPALEVVQRRGARLRRLLEMKVPDEVIDLELDLLGTAVAGLN